MRTETPNEKYFRLIDEILETEFGQMIGRERLRFDLTNEQLRIVLDQCRKFETESKTNG